MHASILIAGLAASLVSATPLIARDFGQDKWQPSFAPAPTGQPSPSNGSTPSAPSPPPQVDSKPPVANAPAGPPSMTTPSPPASSPSQLGKPGAPNPTTPKGLIGELLTADSTVARFKELKSEIDAQTISLKFDHNPAANPNVTAGLGGQVDLANRANFPVLTGLGLSSAVIFFQPCGLNTPHIHPRASEYFTLATDSKMSTGFVLENGLTDEFTTELGIWQGTVFPQGSIHWQQNLDCKPAVGVAGLSSEDPGASSLAQNFLKFTNQDVVEAALGGLPAEIGAGNFAEFKAKLPASLSKGVESCLVRCGIPY